MLHPSSSNKSSDANQHPFQTWTSTACRSLCGLTCTISYGCSPLRRSGSVSGYPLKSGKSSIHSDFWPVRARIIITLRKPIRLLRTSSTYLPCSRPQFQDRLLVHSFISSSVVGCGSKSLSYPRFIYNICIQFLEGMPDRGPSLSNCSELLIGNINSEQSHLNRQHCWMGYAGTLCFGRVL